LEADTFTSDDVVARHIRSWFSIVLVGERLVLPTAGSGLVPLSVEIRSGDQWNF
jgi:hypothetical protein